MIGGSAAGAKAASKARRLDEFADITIIQESPEPSMAACGYPYCTGGVFNNREQLLCTPRRRYPGPDVFPESQKYQGTG